MTVDEARDGAAAIIVDQEVSVGRVLGTEDSTPLSFHVALTRTPTCNWTTWSSRRRSVPGFGQVTIAGVVTEVTARHEGASFGSDVFLISDGVLPARVQETAEITTTRVEPECYVPPRPGEPVRRATGDDREHALYFDQMDRKLPIGLGRDGSPIYINLDFLDGTRGAHISISGISGVATKTSYALFLLHSIFRSGVLGTRAVNAKALVFSVKGEDLLFLDYANIRLDDELRAEIRRPRPAGGTLCLRWLLLTAHPRRPDRPAARHRPDQRRRPVLVDPARVLHRRTAPLRVHRRRGRTQPVHDGRQPGRRPAPAGRATRRQGRRRSASTATTCRTYDELVDVIIDRLTDDATRPQWAGPVTGVGHDQRLHPPAPVVPETTPRPHPRRPARHRHPADLHRQPAGHRRRPAQPPRTGATVRRRRRAGRRDRAEGSGRAGQPAVHHDRRAQQVRTAGGQQPDQGRPAGHRGTRPQPRASS